MPLGDWDKRIGDIVRKGIISRLGIKDGGGETGNQNNSGSKESEDVEDNEGENAGEGEDGGEICYQGTPQELIKIKNNKTAKYLKNQFVKH